jgi:hypothetical protein
MLLLLAGGVPIPGVPGCSLGIKVTNGTTPPMKARISCWDNHTLFMLGIHGVGTITFIHAAAPLLHNCLKLLFTVIYIHQAILALYRWLAYLFVYGF